MVAYDTHIHTLIQYVCVYVWIRDYTSNFTLSHLTGICRILKSRQRRQSVPTRFLFSHYTLCLNNYIRILYIFVLNCML